MKLRIKKAFSDLASFIAGLAFTTFMLLFLLDFLVRNMQDRWYYMLAEAGAIICLGILGLFYIERALDPEIPARLALKKYERVTVRQEMERSKGVSIQVFASGKWKMVRFWRAQNTRSGREYIFTGRKLVAAPTAVT